MKKLLILFVALALTLTLAGCTKEVIVEVEKIVEVEVIVEVPIELADIPTDLGMDDLDDYLGRPDVQYVDLRNFDDKLNSGYIAGFEMIPFFDYLEKTDILVRTDGDWTFAAADIVSQGALRALFNEDKTIFLMCGSGTRAGYVMAALEELGYTDVINVGGLGSYTGDNLVSGDGEYNIEVQMPLPAVVDMANIDMYLGRNDVQYVDLRNFDDKMSSGYIAGFEMIPFFDYLENTGILVRTDGDWTFAAADIGSQGALRALFNEDKTIFVMCGSGTRAGYVMAALESLGYTDVINVGGIGSYTGDNLVAGDGEYMNEVSVLGPYTPGIYFGYDPVGKYNATVVIGQGGGIYSVFFDAAYGDSTKQDLGFDYNMKLYSGGDYEWFEHANMLGDFIVANQGWDGITLDEVVFDDTWNALTVPHHFITIDNDNSPDAISGVSIGAEGFVLAWNAAIAQATDAGTEGIVATTITPTMWAEAHDPAILYVDGEYIVSVDGYSAIITIEGGEIVDVFLDTLNAEDLIQDYDDTGALIALGDGEDDTFTPKSTLSIGEYPMNYFMNDNGEWELKLVDEELAIDVAGVVAGNASYSTQVYQEGFAVTTATQYRITFDAYAENARDINVNFGDALTVDPWFTPYMTTSVISLTTTVQTFTIDFTMAEATTADQGKLVFELGAIAGVAVNGMVVIDNVMIEEFDGTAVIAATDQVVNGDFADSDMIGWGVWTGDQWSGVNTSSLPRLLDWWAQADALEAAIIETQQWALDLDDVSGVTISVYNWENAVKEIFAEAATPITVTETINTVDGQVVLVEGVITSIMFDGTFTMEDPDGTAIYIDDYSANITWGDLTIAVGDEVQVLAIRSDYNGLNLVDDVSMVTVLSTGNAITDAIVITDMATFRTNATSDDFAKRYIFTNIEILETGYYAYFFEPVDGEDRMGIVTSYSDDTIVLTAGDFVTFTATWYGTNGDYTDNTKIFRFSVTQASDYVIVTPAP